jgi:ribonuclease E
MPNNPRAGGVSRRIEGEDRDQMREVMGQLQIPDGMGAIVRTAGVGRSAEELQWDLDNLRTQWEQIEAGSKDRAAPFLVYRESDAVTRAMRDYLGDDIGEVLVDDPAAYEKAQAYMQRFFPNEAQRRLKMYNDDIALFTRFQIESQIESAYAHKVQLPSGGSIVVDYTEALVSIDINSARATRGSDIETTATNTNLEAADEIARQLRIRDIGGLIVIDFIDMESTKNQRDVEDRLRDAMKADRARIQIGRLSRFGLLEMSRQRLRPSLSDSSHIVCPRCVGNGSIRSVESMALAVLRLIGEEIRKDRTSRVIAQVPVDVATYLINEKREWLRQLEDKSSAELIIVPNLHMQTPDFNLRRVRDDETELTENKVTSYLMPSAPIVVEPGSAQDKKPQQEAAAVATILPATSAPIVEHAPVLQPPPPAPEPQMGVLSRFKRWLVGDPQPIQATPPVAAQAPGSSSSGGHSRRDRSDRGDRGHRRDRDSRRGGGDRDHRPHRQADGSRREREGAGGETRDRDSARSEGQRSEGRNESQRSGGEGHRDRDRNRGRGGGEGRHDNRGGEHRAREGGERTGGADRGGERSDRGDRGGDRNRDRSRGGERGERSGGHDRDRDRNRDAHAPRPQEEAAVAAAAGVAASAVSAEVAGNAGASPDTTAGAAPGYEGGGGAPGPNGERGERTGRGRRGRRRGRRGGGGGAGREGGPRSAGGQEGLFEGGEGDHSGGDVDGNRSPDRGGEADGNRVSGRGDVDGNRASGYSNGGDTHRSHESQDSAPREPSHRESAPRESTPRESGAGESAPRERESNEPRHEEPRSREREPQESRHEEQRSREPAAANFGAESPAPARQFEPAAPAASEGAGSQQRPYVVWSSSPTTGTPGRRDE